MGNFLDETYIDNNWDDFRRAYNKLILTASQSSLESGLVPCSFGDVNISVNLQSCVDYEGVLTELTNAFRDNGVEITPSDVSILYIDEENEINELSEETDIAVFLASVKSVQININ